MKLETRNEKLHPSGMPDESEPSPEDLEMAVEELTGKPTAGNPAERIEALKKRIIFLEAERRTALDRPDDVDRAEWLAANQQDLDNARRQLADFKAQHDGRN